MKSKIIYNPKSGRSRLQPKMSYVIETLSAAGYQIEVYPTKGPRDACDVARHACRESYDLVIAVGGDGTASEVVNGLANFGGEEENVKRPLFAYIPSGTSNDFAKSLGIPNNLKKAMHVVIHGERAYIDIGCLNQKQSFNYIVAIGAFTSLTYTTSHRLKRTFGFIAYLKDLLREFPMVKKPFVLNLTVDGKEYSGEYILALIINSPIFAGMKKILSSNQMDDGLFDILLLSKCTPKILFLAFCGLLGLNVDPNAANVRLLHGKKIFIDSALSIPWNIDGDFGGYGYMSIDCKKKFLEMMVPAQSIGRVLANQHETFI